MEVFLWGEDKATQPVILSVEVEKKISRRHLRAPTSMAANTASVKRFRSHDRRRLSPFPRQEIRKCAGLHLARFY